jgi:CheY-like chemotaxis protein
MKHKSVLKDFRALSFDGGRVTDAGTPALRDSQSRLTPDGAQDFDVHEDRSAAGDASPPERSGATRQWPELEGVTVRKVQAGRWLLAPATPACPQARENAARDDSPAADVAGPRRTLRKKTILALMMNPELFLRLRLTRVLGAEGYEVLWATTLHEAVTAGQQHPVDLLLVDFSLPLRSTCADFDGLIAAHPDWPVILLADRKTEFEQTVSGRVSAVLEKPFGNAVLVHTIHTLLGQPPHEHLQGSGHRKAVSSQAA